MNLDLTRQSLFTNILYVVLLSIIFWGGWLLAPELTAKGNEIVITGTSLGKWIDSTFVSLPTLGIILSSLLVFINSLIVTRICVRNVIFLERSYMPALVYVIISAGYFNSYLSFRPLLVSMLLLGASGQIFKSYNLKTLATGAYLKIGFYFGLAAIIYPPAIFMLFMLLIALRLFRLFSVREWLSALAGFALPIFFAAYTDWLMGSSFTEFYDNYLTALTTSVETMPSWREMNILEWGFLVTIALLIMLSVTKFISRRKILTVKAFKSYIYFVWMFVTAMLIMILVPCRSLNMLPIIATPLAVIVPSYFNAAKPSFIMNFLYALLIGGAIALHIIPHL